MTSKTSYTTVYTCDYCGAQASVERGDSIDDSNNMSYAQAFIGAGWTTSYEFDGRHYIGSSPSHFCSDCKESFKQWMASRIKK